MQAHRAGTLHLAVSVFVFDRDDMLIQRRAATKYHCGGQWANTCCTHPYWDEPLKEAAQRRLFEELGFRLPLAPAGTLTYATPVTQGLFEHERVQVFAGAADRTRLRLAPNPEEVMETRWTSRAELKSELEAQPQNIAPWFRIYLKRWSELGLREGADATV